MGSDNNYILGVANVLLVVVGLVLHIRVIGGGRYDLAVYYSAILGELEVNLVTVDINGLDSQLVALFHLEGCAGGDGHLVIIVHQDLEKLLVGENILVVRLLEKDVICALGINIAGKVLVSQEADDQELAPCIEVEAVSHSFGVIDYAIGLQELSVGNCCGQFFGLDVVIDIVVKAGKVIRCPGVTISGNMAANFYSVGCSYYHRCCQQQHHRCKCNCSQFLHLLTSYFPIQSIQQHTV